MPATPQFDINRTNHYPGDFSNRLARTFNEHNHTAVQIANFLAYELERGSQVGFVGGLATPDPFGVIGNNNPLTVIGLTATSISLSRNSTVSTLGSLTYVVGGTPKTIINLKATINSPVVEFATNTTGTIDSNLLARLITRTTVVDAPLVANPNPIVPPTFPSASDILLDLDVTNSYLETPANPQQNPTLTLQRGKTYTFLLSPSIVANNHFNITSSVREPNIGLDRYPFGVSTLSSGAVKFIVPYDAPAQLFYQSSTSKYIYGELQIVSGAVNPAQPLLTAWQTNDLNIPTAPPEAKLYLCLSNPNDYRVTDWTVVPSWSNNSPSDAFIQLQAAENSAIFALSELLRLQTIDKISALNLIPNIIPANATVYCAVYGNQDLVRLTQQLTTIDVTASS